MWRKRRGQHIFLFGTVNTSIALIGARSSSLNLHDSMVAFNHKPQVIGSASLALSGIYHWEDMYESDSVHSRFVFCFSSIILSKRLSSTTTHTNLWLRKLHYRGNGWVQTTYHQEPRFCSPLVEYLVLRNNISRVFDNELQILCTMYTKELHPYQLFEFIYLNSASACKVKY